MDRYLPFMRQEFVPENLDLFIDPDEAASFLHLPRTTIIEMASAGALPSPKNFFSGLGGCLSINRL